MFDSARASFETRRVAFDSAARRVARRRVAALLVGLSCLFPTAALAAEPGLPRNESPEGARVYFVSPEDGETLGSPVIVRFGLSAMGVAPAGVEKHGTGHHHLIVDADLPPANLPVPNSDHYRHFGKGQTEVELELAPGTHTLQLLVADHNHIPHDPPVVSERISISVE